MADDRLPLVKDRRREDTSATSRTRPDMLVHQTPIDPKPNKV